MQLSSTRNRPTAVRVLLGQGSSTLAGEFARCSREKLRCFVPTQTTISDGHTVFQRCFAQRLAPIEQMPLEHHPYQRRIAC